MTTFPRDLVTDARGRVVRLPDEKTRARIVVVARELERLAGELSALGIDQPSIEARFIALSIKHRRALDYIDAGIVSSIGNHQLRYVQHLCAGHVVSYGHGAFSIRQKDAADEAVA